MATNQSDLADLLLKLLMSRGEAFIGLSTLQPAADEPPSLAAFSGTEPVNFIGYERQRVDMRDWKMEDGRAIGPQVVWRNGDARPWPTLRSSFIATTQRGSGVLLGWSMLKAPRLLMNSDSLALESSINLEATI